MSKRNNADKSAPFPWKTSPAADKRFRELVKAHGTKNHQLLADEMKASDASWVLSTQQVHTHIETIKAEPKKRGRPSGSKNKRKRTEDDDDDEFDDDDDEDGFIEPLKKKSKVDDTGSDLGTIVSGPMLIVKPEVKETEDYKFINFPTMPRTDVNFQLTTDKSTNEIYVTAEVKQIAEGKNEVDKRVHDTTLGTRNTAAMLESDRANPNPLPQGDWIKLQKEDLRAALHRPQSVQKITPAGTSKTSFLLPDDCVPVQPIGMKEEPNMPTHGIALLKKEATCAPVTTLVSNETKALRKLEEETAERDKENDNANQQDPTPGNSTD